MVEWEWPMIEWEWTKGGSALRSRLSRGWRGVQRAAGGGLQTTWCRCKIQRSNKTSCRHTSRPSSRPGPAKIITVVMAVIVLTKYSIVDGTVLRWPRSERRHQEEWEGSGSGCGPE